MAEKNSCNDKGVGTQALSPDLVRQVADLVYQKWLRELQSERERSRLVFGDISTQYRRGR